MAPLKQYRWILKVSSSFMLFRIDIPTIVQLKVQYFVLLTSTDTGYKRARMCLSVFKKGLIK